MLIKTPVPEKIPVDSKFKYFISEVLPPLSIFNTLDPVKVMIAAEENPGCVVPSI